LLIDGHNLIGRMPDLDLDDPDDEVKLVLRLRAYCSRARKRATVVFDSGLPGGPSDTLSGAGVKAVFASSGRSADGILLERIRGARNPRGLIVVTSDQRIVDAARARHMRAIRSEEFAQQLVLPSKDADSADVQLSPEEVDDWLAIFQRGHPR
jgi:predicted RNA-binding protein with PIN domain